MTDTSPVLNHWQQHLGVAASDGRIAALGDTAREAALIENQPSKTPFASLGVVEVSGADAAEFLHAQFSADCRALAVGQSVLTAWCSPKGRVLFLPRILRLEQAHLLLLPLEQIAAFIKRLRMFVLRAAVEIIDRSTTHAVVRCDDRDDARPAPAGGATDRTQHFYVTPLDRAAELWAALDGVAVGEAAARLIDIRLGLAQLGEGLAEQFLPQELNLDVGAGVSFNKGCYPGQEIVARVKFRGSVKRRLAHLVTTDPTLPACAARLFDAGEQTIGTVLFAERLAVDGCALLAVLDHGHSTVRLADGSALTRAALTYDLVDS